MPRPTVILGLLGPSLDSGRGPDRWERWRPSISCCQHDDLLPSRFELLFQRQFTDLARQISTDIAAVSPETFVNTHLVPFDDAWDFERVYTALHDFALAYDFRPEDEDYLIHITTGSHVAQICLFLLTESRHLPGRLLQTSPPRKDTSRCGGYEIIDLDLSRYDRLATRFSAARASDLSFLKSGIDTRNPRFNQLIERIERVASASTAPLLLTGPTGSGKSRLARKIYDLKKNRRQLTGPFVEVNCATLRGDGAMSALFGHRRGAFTGALTDRPGLLRSADKGLLFLDEIGELGLDEQAMLLRALEDKRFLPVGSDKEVESDFQLIAGTNRDLSDCVRRGLFREDLLARINLWTFRLPALRERPEDIAPNLDYELAEYARRTGTRATINREARDRFLSFATSPSAAWPANFRDLSAAVTRMLTLSEGSRITLATAEEEITRLTAQWVASNDSAAPTDDRDLLVSLLPPEALDQIDLFDLPQLAQVIRVCRRSRTLSEAGRTLFQHSRQSRTSINDADRLRKYLARFDLDWTKVTKR
jgi:transcriptional regulatory protein RtcR